MTCEETDEAAWAAEGISRGDEVIPCPDSPARVFDILKIPMFEEDGTRKGLIVVGRDITERKQAEQALMKRNEELERFERAVIGREMKMIKLKKRIAELEEELNKKGDRHES
jgi:hypothetical protein